MSIAETEVGLKTPELLGGTIVTGSGEEITYSEIFQTYADSVYGEFHASQDPRFSQKYAYEFPQMLKDLGDDVHPVNHQKHTAEKIVLPMIAAQQRSSSAKNFQEFDVKRLTLAALLHDIGECKSPLLIEKGLKVVGDVAKSDVTEADEKKEKLIRAYLYNELYGDLPGHLLEQTEIAIDKTPGDYIAETFNTAENLGYYMTGIRAAEIALASICHIESQPRIKQLGRLASKVARNWRPALEVAASAYPFVDSQLEATNITYKAITTKITPRVVI